MFTLVKSVEVIGTGALLDGVMDKIDDITQTITNELDTELGQ